MRKLFWPSLALSLVVAGRAHADEGDDEPDDVDDTGDIDDAGDVDDIVDVKQPAITAGGLFVLRTYPLRENERPLTMTEHITQLRSGIGTDVSNKGAFESAGVSLEGIHGYADNFSLLGGFTSAYNLDQFAVYGGFEGALVYDVLDLRVAGRVSRTAIAHPLAMGEYDASDTKAAVDIGLPVRYVARPEIAIVALQTVMSVDLNATNCGDSVLDAVGCNGTKPDLNPSLAIVTNPIAPVSLVVQAQLQVIDFDFTNRLRVPATIRIQYSPNARYDIGGEFTLLNVKPTPAEEEMDVGPFDNRFLSLFLAARFGP